MNDLPLNVDPAPVFGDDVTTVTPSSPGAVLVATRQARGLTIEQVASQLNLAPRQVVALETDNFAALPGMVIARGFLRSYAKLLKVDPAPLLAALGDPYQASNSVPMRHALSTSFSESRMPSLNSTGQRNRWVPGTVGLAILVAAAAASYALGWWPEALTRKVIQMRAGLGSANTISTPGGTANGAADKAGPASENEAAPVAGVGSAETSVLDASGKLSNTLSSADNVPPPRAANDAKPAQPAIAPTVLAAGSVSINALSASLGSRTPEVTTAGPGANPLVLDFKQDSWVELRRANNSVVVAKTIKAGSVETFDVSEPLTLIIGNIAGVHASLRGTALDLSKSANGNVVKLRLK